MSIWVRLLLAFCAILGGAAEAFDLGAMENPALHSDQMVRIGDGEIKHAITSATITPNRNLSPASFQFSETFDQDGKWSSDRQERRPKFLNGHWWVYNRELCVSSGDFGTKCRAVFRNKLTGGLVMEDLRASLPDDVGGGPIEFTIIMKE